MDDMTEYEFARHMEQADQTRLYAMLSDTIDMYVEWIDVHGKTPDEARHLAAQETLDGLSAAFEELQENDDE